MLKKEGFHATKKNDTIRLKELNQMVVPPLINLIPVLEKQRQAPVWVQRQSGLHSETLLQRNKNKLKLVLVVYVCNPRSLLVEVEKKGLQ